MPKDTDVKDPYASLKGAQSLMRALDILDQVINGPVKSADLARNLDLTRSTTHRLAQALRARDYLAITPDGYSLGPKLLQLGSMAQEQTDYVGTALVGFYSYGEISPYASGRCDLHNQTMTLTHFEES